MTHEKIIAAKKKQRDELEAGNERSYMELGQDITAHGARFGGMDTSDMRRELFYEMLVEWGIVSEEQMLDFDIRFHEKVEEALNAHWSEWNAAKAERNKPSIALVKNFDKLLGPNGMPPG